MSYRDLWTRNAGWIGAVVGLSAFAIGVVAFEPDAAIPELPTLEAPRPVAVIPLAPEPRAARPHNLILISIDTLRADHLSLYGYSRTTSPSVDALGDESIVFERAYSQSPKTAESHMTLFTGLYPGAHGVKNLRASNRPLGVEVPTLASMLSAAGYRTAAFHGAGNITAELGFDRGFDLFEAPGNVDLVFDAGARWLETHAAGAPFFLFLHTGVTHDPYRPPAEYAERFVDPDYAGDIGPDADARRQALKEGGYWRLHELWWELVDHRDPADVQHLRDLYDALIARMDEQLARFLARSEALGLADSTLLVFLSDHGEEFLDHRGFRHSNVHREVMHVPLIVRLPGSEGQARRGLRVKAPVQLVDVLPTLLDALGLPIPAHVQGRSLAALLDSDVPVDHPVFSQWESRKLRALRTEEWTYIRTWSGERLYHLPDDPDEHHDVSAERPKVLAQLRRATASFASASEEIARGLAPPTDFELPAGARDQLEALGYLDGLNGPQPLPSAQDSRP
jgi:arylsulfatase A-like enzyme